MTCFGCRSVQTKVLQIKNNLNNSNQSNQSNQNNTGENVLEEKQADPVATEQSDANEANSQCVSDPLSRQFEEYCKKDETKNRIKASQKRFAKQLAGLFFWDIH